MVKIYIPVSKPLTLGPHENSVKYIRSDPTCSVGREQLRGSPISLINSLRPQRLINSKQRNSYFNFINVFTCRFYARRSRKLKKLLELTVLIALLGSESVKAARKMLVKLTPCFNIWTDSFLSSSSECLLNPFTGLKKV